MNNMHCIAEDGVAFGHVSRFGHIPTDATGQSFEPVDHECPAANVAAMFTITGKGFMHRHAALDGYKVWICIDSRVWLHRAISVAM